MADSTQEFNTVLAPDTAFKGEASFESSAKLMGRFEGSISGKGKVYVADGSKIKATIKAREITVEGVLEGNVEAIDRVELKPKGAINGDIVAARMTMAEGASIDGHCRIGVKAGVASATEVKPTAHAQAQPQTPAAARK